MISLKQAISLNSNDIEEFKKELNQKIKLSNLNAYKEQYTKQDIIPSATSGIPINIKDIISVKNQELQGASNILKGYKAPFNATVIDNLHKNNFCAFGRANMDEFAMGSLGDNSYIW